MLDIILKDARKKNTNNLTKHLRNKQKVSKSKPYVCGELANKSWEQKNSKNTSQLRKVLKEKKIIFY